VIKLSSKSVKLLTILKIQL